MKVILYSSNKNFAKENPNIKKSLIKALNKLSKKVETYYSFGITFERIIDDDTVKYDKCGDFFTYKFMDSQGKCIQLRILYHCTTINNEIKIYLIDYCIKRNYDKSYIKEFEKIGKQLTIEKVLSQATEI